MKVWLNSNAILGSLIGDQFSQEEFTVATDRKIKLLRIAMIILNKAIYYTPVDTGTLRDSSYIEEYEDGFVVGYNADYAVYVHEIEKNEHPYGQYKFLEDAALETYNEVTDIDFSIGIEYNPLRVYVGVSSEPGGALVGSNSPFTPVSPTEYFEELESNKMFDILTSIREIGADGLFSGFGREAISDKYGLDERNLVFIDKVYSLYNKYIK